MGFPSKLISSASVRPGTLYTHQKHNHFPNMVSDWLHDTLVMVNAFVVYIYTNNINQVMYYILHGYNDSPSCMGVSDP